jgi:hypothetical protein
LSYDTFRKTNVKSMNNSIQKIIRYEKEKINLFFNPQISPRASESLNIRNFVVIDERNGHSKTSSFASYKEKK